MSVLSNPAGETSSFLSVGKFCQDQITQSFFIEITEVFIEKSESHARD